MICWCSKIVMIWQGGRWIQAPGRKIEEQLFWQMWSRKDFETKSVSNTARWWAMYRCATRRTAAWAWSGDVTNDDSSLPFPPPSSHRAIAVSFHQMSTRDRQSAVKEDNHSIGHCNLSVSCPIKLPTKTWTGCRRAALQDVNEIN